MVPSRFLPLRRSARASLCCAAATAILAALTAWQLEEWLGALTLAALAGFILCALYTILGMNRYWVAAVASATTAATIGCSLAFLRMLGLAWDDAPDSVTTVSSRDADPYFVGAVVAALATLGILFVASAWPRRRRTVAKPARKPVARPTAQRPSPKAPAPKPPAARAPASKPAPPRPTGASGRASGSRPAARRNG
ncbi:hypothetical protein [Sinomonas gamaensis]|uniref:hypothetical protein n=1 Tax=Sinomonas gamaensis TaxID=2565624 RepID=UPI001107E762|nr:hypothetical protein [Sinomonas gamaensis]